MICVCYCAVLSVVRKMSEAKVHVSVEQCIIIKFLTKEGSVTVENLFTIEEAVW
jgi:hypothetical protein